MDEETYEIKTKIIRNMFDDQRAIKCSIPDDALDVEDDIHPGGDVFKTEDGEFIDLELQLMNFDEAELVKYIRFAEELYEKHQKPVAIYIICPEGIDVCVKECTIHSKADFVIKLARVDVDPCKIALQAIKNKIKNSQMLDGDDVFALSMLAMLCRPEERDQYLKEYFRIMNRL